MKIKIEHSFPRVSVSEVIEVGTVKNNCLNKRQLKLIDDAISERLHAKLIEKLQKQKPQTELKHYDRD